jgi:hypothetical protein
MGPLLIKPAGMMLFYTGADSPVGLSEIQEAAATLAQGDALGGAHFTA